MYLLKYVLHHNIDGGRLDAYKINENIYNIEFTCRLQFLSSAVALLSHTFYCYTALLRERERTDRSGLCFQLLSCGVFQLSYFVIKKNSELICEIWLRMNQWKQKTLQVWIQTHRKGRKELCNFGLTL